MDPSGKYALVTGASSGIGWHLAFQFAMRGYNILAVSNQPVALGELKKELENTCNITVQTLDMDLSTVEAATSLFGFCVSRGIQVEVLANNAGMLLYRETVASPLDQLRSILQLHVNTPVLLCRLFGEGMKARGSGHILNTSSISSVMPYPMISVYGPSKAFLRHFTRALRSELKPRGVHVTCLLPGATDTPLNEDLPFNVGRGKRFGLVKTPESVARSGVNALFRNRPVCIPGFINKLIIIMLPLMPQGLISILYSRMIRSERQGKQR